MIRYLLVIFSIIISQVACKLLEISRELVTYAYVL